MNYKKVLLFSTFATAMALTSCVNEDYDLSNIDTTIGVEVKGLKVAIKMDSLRLDKVMDLDEDNVIKKVIDPVSGKEIYAIVEEGTFNSDPINISGFNTNVPKIEDIKDNLSLKYVNTELQQRMNVEIEKRVDQAINEQIAALRQQYKNAGLTDSQIDANPDYQAQKAAIEGKRESIKQEKLNNLETKKSVQEAAWASIDDDEVFAEYDISHKNTVIECTSNDVHKAIRKVDYLKADATIKVSLVLNELKDVVNIILDNTSILFPKGLEMTCKDPSGKTYEYDPKTGILQLGRVDFGKNAGQYDLDIKVTGLDANLCEVKLVAKNNAPGSFVFKNEVYVRSGQAVVTKKNFVEGKTVFELPEEAAYTCKVKMSDIDVKSFTGKILYDVDAPEIDDISINDLPDVLTDKGTNILLANPQIYFSATNPLYEDNLKAEIGVRLTPYRDNVKGESCELDNKIATISGEKAMLCFAPEKPEKMYQGYENAEFNGFKDLKKVISGAGVPNMIQVDVTEARVPETQVTDFKLGRSLDAVKGEYTFYAPLALGEGSVVEYKDTIELWDEDTAEKLDVSELTLNAKVVSELPLNASLVLTPIDVNGNVINGINCEKVEIKAQQTEQVVKFRMTSTVGIKKLDSLILRATVVGDNAEKALEPNQFIYVKEAVVSVTGKYISEDKD